MAENLKPSSRWYRNREQHLFYMKTNRIRRLGDGGWDQLKLSSGQKTGSFIGHKSRRREQDSNLLRSRSSLNFVHVGNHVFTFR